MVFISAGWHGMWSKQRRTVVSFALPTGDSYCHLKLSGQIRSGVTVQRREYWTEDEPVRLHRHTELKMNWPNCIGRQSSKSRQASFVDTHPLCHWCQLVGLILVYIVAGNAISGGGQDFKVLSMSQVLNYWCPNCPVPTPQYSNSFSYLYNIVRVCLDEG
jgi:hypothetical protein